MGYKRPETSVPDRPRVSRPKRAMLAILAGLAPRNALGPDGRASVQVQNRAERRAQARRDRKA